MQTTLYAITVPVFTKHLKNMLTYLDKAEELAETKKFDVNTLLHARLAPDQFPLVKQIQLMSDHAKAHSFRLNDEEPPAFEDTETTLADLRTRIQKTIDVLNSVTPERVNGKEDAHVKLRFYPGKFLSGLDFTTEFSLPHFYFHVTTAYSILRHNGVDLGKKDFIGSLTLQDEA